MIQLGRTVLHVPCRGSEFSDLERHVRETIPQDVVMPWLSRAYPGSRLAGIAGPEGFRGPDRVRLNRFHYPCRGASRFGYGHFLATSRDVERVRKEAFDDDLKGTPNPMTLTISSDGIHRGTPEDPAIGPFACANVYLLAATPLGRVSVEAGDDRPYVPGLYLLTVAEERFRWWWRAFPGPAPEVADDPSWADLFAACAKAVGRTIHADPVLPVYLRPGRVLAKLAGEPVGPVLDAICDSVGFRFYRALDGTFNAVGPKAGVDAYRAGLRGERSVRAGGFRFLEAL